MRDRRNKRDHDKQQHRLRGRITHVRVRAERAVVNDIHGRHRGICRAAVGHDKHLIVELEGADNTHRDNEEGRRREQGQRNFEKHARTACSVDARRLVKLGRDPRQRGGVNDHVSADPLPHGKENDRDHCRIARFEPLRPADSQQPQKGIDDADIGIEYKTEHRCRRHRTRKPRNVINRTEHLPALHVGIDEHGVEKRQQNRERNGKQRIPGNVYKRFFIDVVELENVGKILKPDPVNFPDPVVLRKRKHDCHYNGHERKQRKEHAGGQHEEKPFQRKSALQRPFLFFGNSFHGIPLKEALQAGIASHLSALSASMP